MTSLLPNPFSCDESSPTERRPNGSPAPGQELCGAGDLVVGTPNATFFLNDSIQTDLIGEIFVGARKLNLPRFKLDEERFMLDLEEPPLFLRAAQ
jgi:hypothetical protein